MICATHDALLTERADDVIRLGGERVRALR